MPALLQLVHYVGDEGSPVSLDALALAVEIADEQAVADVRSFGIRLSSAFPTSSATWRRPRDNPDVERRFERAVAYLVARGRAERPTPTTVMFLD